MRDPKRSIVRPTLGVKDDNGTFLPIPDVEADLDAILAHQLRGLAKLTKHIVLVIESGNVEKETANQLATCIKVTMELKSKQKEILDDLPDEDLVKLAQGTK